jgi:sulfur-oxidizing protein SoxY
MPISRRRLIKLSTGFCTGVFFLLQNRMAHALWPASHFMSGPLEQTLRQIQNGKAIVETNKIELNIPEIAENGALVPITVTSSLTDIKTLSIIVEQNPVPLILQAQLSPNLMPFLSARLKVASSSFVFVIAEADKVCYSVKKKVKVTIGGCGG